MPKGHVHGVEKPFELVVAVEPQQAHGGGLAGGAAQCRHLGTIEGVDLLGAFEEPAAHGREARDAATALDQGVAQLGLEGGHVLAERRLGHVQLSGCTAEVEVLGKAGELAEDFDAHGRGPFPMVSPLRSQVG